MHPWGCALCRLWLFQVPWHDCGKLAWAWFKSEFLYPKKLVFQSDSLYYEAMEEAIAEGEKPPRKRKKPQAPASAGKGQGE